MKIRLGNDFAHVWVVERLGEPENLDAARDIEMYLRSANGSVPIAFAVQDGNKIRTQFTAANVPAIGDYSLLLTYIGSDSNRHTLDLDAFTIVSSSAKADQVDEFTSTSEVAIGLRGADAFQVWQSQSGNEGKTYEEYIAYLREPMTLAIEQGNDTAAEWAVEEAERVANEVIREENEEDRISAEITREQVKVATIIAKNEAIQATSDANDAASLANSKADLANDAATLANSKAGLADIAATNANSKADLAVTAATNANDAADLANSKAGIAQTAADNADTKAGLADTAATNANTVSTNVADAEAARVLAGSEVKTNKTSDIETNKTSTDKYPNAKGVVDYVNTARLAIQTDLGLKLDKTAVKQTTGTSETDVMSQKAVADELALKEATSNKQNSLTTDGTGVKFPTVDAVNARLALKADKAQEAWMSATLLNGWTGDLRYAKSSNGFVTIWCNLTAGTVTTNTVICNIPAGYRGDYALILLRDMSTGVHDVRLVSNGLTVYIHSGSATGRGARGEVTYYAFY